MSTLHDPSKAVLIRPLPPPAAEPRWRVLTRAVPVWTVLALLPLLAVLAGGALGTIGTP
jgi:hypothetical protein